MQCKRFNYGANRVFDFLSLWILPIGYLLLLSAMFFLPGRMLLTKVYSILFSVPTLVLLMLRPREIKELLREPLILAFIAFSVWACLSLLWSPPEHPDYGLAKIPLQTFMLFAGCALLVHYRNEALKPVLFGAALIALVASLINIGQFIQVYVPGARMTGGGAFDNPLLSSHLFGFFCCYWLYVSITTERLKVLWFSIPALAVMFAAIMATGSRTPLVALVLAALWLTFISRNRRSLLMIAGMVLGSAAILLLFPDLLGNRGGSYRLQLWQLALEKIGDHPLIGHGYDSELYLDIGVGYLLREPHSFSLGVLYYVGIIGLLPWLFMLGWGLFSSYKQRVQPLFMLASTLLVYGIGAGLTEGGAILSRPREHWFLLWIPLALTAAMSIARRRRSQLDMPVQNLAPAAFEQMCKDAKIIESDGLGPKVFCLSDGTFLKLFRPRRWYTSGSFNPYAERFVVNSERLRTLEIPTPPALHLYRLDDGSSAVHYQPLPGLTLRQALQSLEQASLRDALLTRFGRFMAQLHERGVYFRSLHLGNVLLMDDGEFGLIDLADLHTYPSALSHGLRQRNLRHMQRYPQDRNWLFEQHFDALLAGYQSAASERAVQSLRQQVLSLKPAS